MVFSAMCLSKPKLIFLYCNALRMLSNKKFNTGLKTASLETIIHFTIEISKQCHKFKCAHIFENFFGWFNNSYYCLENAHPTKFRKELAKILYIQTLFYKYVQIELHLTKSLHYWFRATKLLFLESAYVVCIVRF